MIEIEIVIDDVRRERLSTSAIRALRDEGYDVHIHDKRTMVSGCCGCCGAHVSVDWTDRIDIAIEGRGDEDIEAWIGEQMLGLAYMLIDEGEGCPHVGALDALAS